MSFKPVQTLKSEELLLDQYLHMINKFKQDMINFKYYADYYDFNLEQVGNLLHNLDACTKEIIEESEKIQANEE